MKRTGFVSEEEVQTLKASDAAIKEKIKSLPKESQEAIEIVNATFNEMNNDVFDFESEARVRKAGYTQSQAEDIAKLSRKYGVGKMFQYGAKSLVLTPFKTVVESQIYLTTIQDRLLEVTSVSTEIEIANLKKKLNEFTSLSFFGLIGLAFKQLFQNLLKGKNNG